MRFRIRFARQVVGVFVLIAILGMAGILILLGANQRWFARNYYFHSRFNSASGLSVGMPIQLKGFEIGKVDRISLSKTNLVEIDFYVYDTYYDKVLPNSVLELAASPIGLGGGSLRFHPGRGEGPPLEELTFIPSLDLAEGKTLVAAGLVEMPEGQDMIGSLVGQIQPILAEVSATLVSVHALTDAVTANLAGQGDGPVAGILNNLAATSNRLNGLLDRVDGLTSDLATITSGLRSDLPKLTASVAGITDNVTGITGNLEATTAALRDPTGLVPKLLDPKGSVATLLNDNNQLFNEIQGALKEVNAIIGQLSQFSTFVNSTQPQIAGLLEKGKTALDQGADVLEAVKNNPLLRGGVPEQKEQGTTFQSYRDKDF